MPFVSGVILAASAALALIGAVRPAPIASDLRGQVVFAALAVPGATVTASQAGRTVVTTSDDAGIFAFTNLDAGAWTVRVEMRGFATASRDVTLPLSGPPFLLTLTMRSYAEIVGGAGGQPARAVASPAETAEDPGIVNGSVINGAVTAFAQPRAFGNNRPGLPSPYNGSVSALAGNSAWNARPYSFDGASATVPSFGDLQLGFTIGGPLRIPWLVKNGPQTFVGYQHGVIHTASTHSAMMPTVRERSGDLSLASVQILDPVTGAPFPGNTIPSSRIVPQARALLQYYPLPNAAASASNYEAPLVTATTQDSLQVGLSQNVGRRTSVAGSLGFQRTSADSESLFGFEDRSRQSTLTAAANYSRRLRQRLTLRLRYQFSRAATGVTPFFANRSNVSGDAGIAGNNQDPENWGPPTLVFPAIADLSDADYQQTVRQSQGAGGELLVRRGAHTLTMGGDFKRSTVDLRSEPDPRGTLTFTGAATGDAFADFLLGVPGASALAFGDTRTRLRGAAYDVYFNDDWRVRPTLTLNLGVRWEYEAPFTEAAGRLVNLDAAPGFTSIRPVTATPANASLVAPDKRGLEPRLAASWRPALGSSLVLRAGYGVYRNLGGYEALALLLAYQPPFSRTFSIQNGPSTPLTLANPFPASLPGTSNTFGIDPGFRSASAHTWQASAQRELPASLTVTAAYLGTKGTHLMQAFLPNTYPAGAANPCADCPSGFVYVTSSGTSLRHAAQFTLRRRLHSGLTALAQYTLAKSTDDAATFSSKGITVRSLGIAQDWLDLPAERGPSSFDQRHLLSVQFQYTSGMGIAGGTLRDGVWGTLLKDWTVTSQLTTGSGLPLTPISFTAVAGTGVVGIRPALTGVPTKPVEGAYANPAAYTAPPPGAWGSAPRHSIRGPAPFALDAGVARTVRLGGRLNLEWRLAATNVLNRVTFATINTVISSPQFGRPTRANPMRALQTALRLRF